MHRDDNVRVPSLDDAINTSSNKKWQTVPQFETTNNAINNAKNGSAAVIRNGKETNTYKWPPLLNNKKDNGQAMMTDYNNGHNGWSNNKNNNDWSKNGNGKDVYERYNYWPELEENSLKKLGGSNNNGSLINSKALLGNGNGYPAELDPLTGAEKDAGDKHHHHHDDDDEGSHCGLGSCQPKWARSFASTHAFMVVFLLAWILQVSSSSFA